MVGLKIGKDEMYVISKNELNAVYDITFYKKTLLNFSRIHNVDPGKIELMVLLFLASHQPLKTESSLFSRMGKIRGLPNLAVSKVPHIT